MKNSDIKSFHKALKKHYASHSLSESQLDELMSLQISVNPSDPSLNDNEKQKLSIDSSYKASNNVNPENRTTWWNRIFSTTRSYHAFYATAFLLLVGLFSFSNFLVGDPLSQKIMDEIVYNHNQNMPVEIESSSLVDISDYLNKLSFSIVMPSALSDKNWQLIGGRYCSINGKLAAQIKVRSLKDNSISTFYQAAIDNPGATEISDTIDGVGVTIWREHGLLLGLAKENLHSLND